MFTKVIRALRVRLFSIKLKIVHKNYFLFICRNKNTRLFKLRTPYHFNKRPWYYQRLFTSIKTVVKKTAKCLAKFRIKFYQLNYICNRFYYQQKALQLGLEESRFFCVVVKRYVVFAHNGLRLPKARRK